MVETKTVRPGDKMQVLGGEGHWGTWPMLPTPGHSLVQSDSSGYQWAFGLHMAQEPNREVTAPCRGQNGGSEGLSSLPRAAKARLEAWALWTQLAVAPDLAPGPNPSPEHEGLLQ